MKPEQMAALRSSAVISEDSIPQAFLVTAATLPWPNGVDSSSPSVWKDGTLYQYNSWGGAPRLATGPSLFALTPQGAVSYDHVMVGGGWLEAIVEAPDGTLYGIYHQEKPDVCPGTNLVVPQIGMARSRPGSGWGTQWEDLGLILQTRTKPLDCAAAAAEFAQIPGNPGFADGVGDPTLVLDGSGQYLYVYFGEYGGDPSEQGLSVARMDFADRDSPSGRVYKYYNGDFTEPGLGGASTPVFPATIPEQQVDASMLWGPTIHWNTYLSQWVMVMNLSGDAQFNNHSGYYYVSYSPDISNPGAWSVPVKLYGLAPSPYYPMVSGVEPGSGTDKLAGQVARFFNGNASTTEIHFSLSPPGAVDIGLAQLTLNAGSSVYNGAYQLLMQSDGNLVLYTSGQPVWSSVTSGRQCQNCFATFQGDGNLVLYDNGSAYWSSGTSGRNAAVLRMQQSAPYLEVLDPAGDVLWSSSAGSSSPPPPAPPPPPGPPTPPPAPPSSGGSCSSMQQDYASTCGDSVTGTSGQGDPASCAGWCASQNANACEWSGGTCYAESGNACSNYQSAITRGWWAATCTPGSAPPATGSFSSGQLTLNGNDVTLYQDMVLSMQGDGNLVIYRAGNPLWASGTSGRSCGTNCMMAFQGDGNLVLYDNGKAYWSTATNSQGQTLVWSGTAPYLKILNGADVVIWRSH
jgi:hypothetical protein